MQNQIIELSTNTSNNKNTNTIGFFPEILTFFDTMVTKTNKGHKSGNLQQQIFPKLQKMKNLTTGTTGFSEKFPWKMEQTI